MALDETTATAATDSFEACEVWISIRPKQAMAAPKQGTTDQWKSSTTSSTSGSYFTSRTHLMCQFWSSGCELVHSFRRSSSPFSEGQNNQSWRLEGQRTSVAIGSVTVFVERSSSIRPLWRSGWRNLQKTGPSMLLDVTKSSLIAGIGLVETPGQRVLSKAVVHQTSVTHPQGWVP